MDGSLICYHEFVFRKGIILVWNKPAGIWKDLLTVAISQNWGVFFIRKTTVSVEVNRPHPLAARFVTTCFVLPFFSLFRLLCSKLIVLVLSEIVFILEFVVILPQQDLVCYTWKCCWFCSLFRSSFGVAFHMLSLVCYCFMCSRSTASPFFKSIPHSTRCFLYPVRWSLSWFSLSDCMNFLFTQW